MGTVPQCPICEFYHYPECDCPVKLRRDELTTYYRAKYPNTARWLIDKFVREALAQEQEGDES